MIRYYLISLLIVTCLSIPFFYMVSLPISSLPSDEKESTETLETVVSVKVRYYPERVKDVMGHWLSNLNARKTLIRSSIVLVPIMGKVEALNLECLRDVEDKKYWLSENLRVTTPGLLVALKPGVEKSMEEYAGEIQLVRENVAPEVWKKEEAKLELEAGKPMEARYVAEVLQELRLELKEKMETARTELESRERAYQEKMASATKDELSVWELWTTLQRQKVMLGILKKSGKNGKIWRKKNCF